MRNIVRSIMLIIVSFKFPLSYAETVIRPTYPATDIPDLSKPAIIKDGNVIYESYPITTYRDYNKPAYVEEKNRDGTSTIYETLPMTDYPDKLKGGYKVEESKH
jgi:hypothetical protein